MKKRVSICIALALVICTLLSLMISVNAATGGFDTINMKISPVSSGGSSSSSSKGKNMWYMTDSFNTGTRYVLRIDGEEVPEKYYINHLNNGNFYSGTNVLKSGSLNNSTWKSHSKISFSSDYNHVTNWRSGSVENFGFSNKDTLAIVDAVKALATKANDTKWINKTNKVYDTTKAVKVEIRAEILIEARTAEDATYYYMTYNEIRKTGMYSGDLEQMGYIRDQRGLDAIACKLYEKDKEYALHSDGSVNCSCNYLKQGGTNLAPLLSSYSYTFIEGNDANITLDYNGQSSGKINYSTGDGFVRLNDGTSRYYGGGRNLQVNMLMPNICSVRINGKYYTPGMGTHSGMSYKSIADGMYFTPARLSAKSKWDKFYVKFPVYVRYSVSVPNFNNNTAYIFEGWDYIVSTRNVDIIENKYTVTEKYLEEGTNTVLATARTTPNLVSGSKHTVEVKTIPGYTYSRSNPTGTTHTITANKEIIHYYKAIPAQTYTVTEKYLKEGTSTVLATAKTTPNLASGSKHTVEIKTISGYTYSKSNPTGTTHTITANKEIIHYYKANPTPPPADVIYSKPIVTKSAQWTPNSDKTEAEITITVQANAEGGSSSTNTKIESADIIYLLDKSYSMGDEVNTSYTKVRNAIADKLNYYLTGKYAGAGNRIGFATFSSNVYTYGKVGVVRYDGKDGRTRTCYNIPNGSALASTTALNYSQAKNRIFSNFNQRANASNLATYTARFYTTTNDISNVINGLKNHKDGENTNFDLPLFYAQWLLENRTNAEQSRKSYIIFVTEGQPYPDTDSARKSEAKRNPEYRNSDYLANKFYAQIAKDLRETYGTEIYAIILERDKANSAMWETICGDSSHVFYTPDTQADAIKAIEKIHEKIALKMEEETVVQYASAAPMTLTDMINTDYFEVIGTNACTTNIGTTRIVNNKVYWDLGTVTYGKKCSDGQWPTLKIKIRLKDDSVTGRLNTNYNRPTDDQCVLTYPDGTVPAPTPWLDREDSTYDVTVKFINDETGSIIKTISIPKIKKNTYWPTAESIKRAYVVTNPTGTWGTKYKGYELNTSKIIVDGITYMLSNMPENLYMNSDKVIEFHYKLEPAELITRTFKVVELNNQIIGVSQLGEDSKTIKIEKSTSVSKPSNPTGTTYVGHKVTYDAKPVVDYTNVYNGLNSATKTSVKISEDQNMACVDFVYKESNYVLTLKYQDENGNTLQPTISSYYPAGTKVTPEVPSVITQNGITYDYVRRSDGQNQTAIITVDKSKEVIFVYKMRAIPVTVKYVDKDTNTEIIPGRVIPVLPGKTTTIDETGIPPEYSFLERSDGKGRTEPVGPVTVPITITLYYKKVSVTLEYRDIETDAILAPTVEIPAHIGDIITPTENGIPAEYCFVERSDGKSRTSSIGPITNSVKVIFYYTKLNVSIEYRDIKTNEEIATAKTNIPIMPGETIPADESGVPSKYTFVKRSDGKSRTSPIGPITEPETIIFYYINIDPTSEDGLPVVSYPQLTAEYTSSTTGNKLIIVGETVKVKIPNSGTHNQMNDYGILEPTEGWNGKYAQVKYLICGCDVYYNGNPYAAGDPILVAERSGSSISQSTIELVVPEWVHEGTYEIKAIVGSQKEDLEDLVYNKKWNTIYEETAAIGTTKLDVIGRVYDFTITNLIEDKYWPNSLYNENKEYKANGAVVNGVTKDKEEHVGSLPIGQGGNQPEKYRYGIALGSTFFFNINTLGLKNTTISIKPQFVYVTNDGEIVEADLYSKVDGKYELINTNTEVGLQTKLNNEHKKERTNLGLELVKAFGIAGFEELNTNYMYNIGNYSRLVLDKTQRMPFTEYFAEEGITLYDGDTAAQNRVLESAVHWYGEYRLPSSTIVMEKGKEPGKGTEYKNGFIIVMFQIVTKDSSDADYLKYNNQVKGDQWGNENGAKETETMTLTLPLVAGQSTNEKVNIKVTDGYYPVAIYQVGVRANGNYEIAGTH